MTGTTKTLIRAVVNEDGTACVLARVCSLDGTGDEYAEGEGNVLKAADLASVSCKVYDLGADETTDPGTEVTPAPTISAVSDVVNDSLSVVGWREDRVGWNFRHDLAPVYVADPGEFRRAEYKFTTTGGGVFFVNVLLETRGEMTS